MTQQSVSPYNEYDAAPKYRDLLRPIGAYLDYLEVCSVSVAETAEGFLWHGCLQQDLTKSRGGFIARAEVPVLANDMREAGQRSRRVVFGWIGGRPKVIKGRSRRNSVCPEGYQEAFRVLGPKLDEQSAANVLLIERAEGLVLRFSSMLPHFIRLNRLLTEVPLSFREETYDPRQMDALTVTARSYRGSRYYH